MKPFMLTMTMCLAGLALAGCQAETAGTIETPSAMPATPAVGAAPAARSSTPQDRLVVYYMHRTFRCPTCLKIEKMSKETVQEAFAPELASGRIQWQTLDFQEREELGTRYGLQTSSLVLVSYRNGQEISHQVLEQAWDLNGQPAEFRDYVVKAVRARLGAVR